MTGPETGTVDPHLQRAHVLLAQSRPDLAERELRQALVRSPSHPGAHALLALCLAGGDAAGRLKEATQEAEAAIQLAPDVAFAHYVLAVVLQRRERLGEASAAIEEAIRLDPEDADFFAQLAAVRLDQRRWADALAAAEEGLRVDPEHVGCNNGRAIALVQLGRRDEAGATIDTALARDPDNAVTHANQGWALLHRADYAAALEHFREALRLDPNLEWARAGVVEALKARNPIYGLLLRYFLWMSRLSGRAQWGVLVAGYMGARVLRGVARTNPQLAPVITPLLLVYGLFVVLTWIAEPLFNLLLRLDRFGRLALSREEIVASNWIGGCLLVAVAAGLLGALTGATWLFVAAFLAGLVVLPLAATFHMREGWPRTAMGSYTALLALLALAGVGTIAAGAGLDEANGDEPSGPAVALLGTFLVGVFLNGWIANALVRVRPKR